MAWYPFLGYSIFWLGLIAAIIIYAIKRKWYPVIYFISICLYAFTVGYVIDVFDVSKNGVLLILAFSAAVMIGLGFYLSKKKNPKEVPNN
jgi:phosphate starvation-inducible membrane PsiE